MVLGQKHPLSINSIQLFPCPIPNLLHQFVDLARKPTHPRTISPQKLYVNIVHLFMLSRAPTVLNYTFQCEFPIKAMMCPLLGKCPNKLLTTSRTALHLVGRSCGSVSTFGSFILFFQICCAYDDK